MAKSGNYGEKWYRIEESGLQLILDGLSQKGYRIIGPTLRDQAIIYDQIEHTGDLPLGWTDEQEAGRYRLNRRNDRAFFGYTVGPHSWKKYLHPPQIRLFQIERKGTGFSPREEKVQSEKLAFVGVRPCELRAIAIQDEVFIGGSVRDPIYASQRDNIFTVAVNCVEAGKTCFCSSMGTGPEATSGYDLVLTEIVSDPEHYFLARASTKKGIALLRNVPNQPAIDIELAKARDAVANAAAQMGRRMNTEGIKELLYQNADHPRWSQIGERCLNCANCTMACPTCFCTSVEDVTSLDGNTAERWRRWDSCFTMDFSYIHGGSIRPSSKARYRQWMTHKLASWIDQFGSSGCVGCGRCITWCPVGIDITEEVRHFQEDSARHNSDARSRQDG